VLLAIAERYAARGEGDNYLHCLSTASRLQPGNAELHLRAAHAMWEVGRSHMAVGEYQKVLELEPEHPEIELMLQRIRGVSDMKAIGDMPPHTSN
jgi:hypothetical protein